MWEGHFPHSHSPTLSVSIRFPRSLILIKKHEQKENENELGQAPPWEHFALRTSQIAPLNSSANGKKSPASRFELNR
jgi:hypothetical protein